MADLGGFAREKGKQRREYKNLGYLLLKAQRMAVTQTGLQESSPRACRSGAQGDGRPLQALKVNRIYDKMARAAGFRREFQALMTPRLDRKRKPNPLSDRAIAMALRVSVHNTELAAPMVFFGGTRIRRSAGRGGQ